MVAKYDWTKVDAWVKENPKQTYPQFKVAFPLFPFCESTYYRRVIKINGGGARTYAKRKTKAVTTISDWTKIDTWIKENPGQGFKKVKAAFPDESFSDATYYQRRKTLGCELKRSKRITTKVGKMASISKSTYKWDKVDSWIEENPDQSHTKFKESFPLFPFTDATYYSRKRKVKGDSRSYTSSRRTLYETLGLIEKKDLQGMSAIEAMKRILSLLDRFGKTHVEIVHLSDPDAIEIRRFTR